MEVIPIKKLCKQPIIEATFSLTGDVHSITLHQYQLKITLSDSRSSLVWNRTKKLKENITNSIKKLTFFTEQNILNTEDESLIIPFTLIPNPTCEYINVNFELLDEHVNCIQSCNINWSKSNHEELDLCLPISDGGEPSSTCLTTVEEIKSSGINITTLGVEKRHSYLVPGDSDLKPLNQSMMPPQKRVKTEKPERKATPIISNYKQMDISQLAHLANSNDSIAQEEILIRFLKTGLTPLMEKLVNPFRWQEIKEKSKSDQRYVYILLHFSEQIENHALYKELKEYVEGHTKDGDALTQIILGYMYETGQGVEQDDKEAVEWYRKAAEQHHPIAQNHLGDMFYAGEGVRFNYQEATKWYRAAAEQGYALAQANLGYMYRKGFGVQPDNAEAIKWYKNAARQGNIAAQYGLALMYKKGKGFKQKSYTKAIKWLEIAASQEDTNAQTELGAIYKDCLRDEGHITKAVEWYTRAATQGNKNAQNALGIIYQEGINNQVDLPKAIFWFSQAENREELLKIFEISNSTLPIPPLGPEGLKALDDIETLGNNLLRAWQEICLQKEYTRKDNHVVPHKEFYQKLEEIMATFIKWKHKLSKQPGLMIDCMLFKAPQTCIVENCQQGISVIPYVRQHVFGDDAYLSIGKENVQLAEEIMHELTHKTLYKEVELKLRKLEADYVQSRIAATGQVRSATAYAYVEEKLNMYLENEAKLQNQGLSKQKEINELKEFLNRINQNQRLDSISIENEPAYTYDFDVKLEKLFNVKLGELNEEREQFEKYYELLIEEVQRGLPYRNREFKKENLYLF
ncbi:MAG: SEL1-like repeat protein [Candidatus Amoebophilus sp.]